MPTSASRPNVERSSFEISPRDGRRRCIRREAIPRLFLKLALPERPPSIEGRRNLLLAGLLGLGHPFSSTGGCITLGALIRRFVMRLLVPSGRASGESEGEGSLQEPRVRDFAVVVPLESIQLRGAV